jgi:hypothetical protein
MVVKKKMGRPVGAKNMKVIAVSTSNTSVKGRLKSPVGFKDVRAEGERLQADEERLMQLIELQRMVKSLEHQAIGYRAVISYLEHTISSSVDK